MIVRRSCGLYPLENLLIFFRDAFQFSLPALLVLGLGIFDAIISTIDIALALFGRMEVADTAINGIVSLAMFSSTDELNNQMNSLSLYATFFRGGCDSQSQFARIFPP